MKKKFKWFLLIVVLVAAVYYVKVVKQEPEPEPEVPVVEVREEVPTRDYKLYVAAPIEYMSLRETPGLGQDVITKIYPGTLIREVGESGSADGVVSLMMETLDGAYKGYLSANYCIEVEYDYDAGKLTIVDTSSAIYSYDDMKADLEQICSTYPEAVSFSGIGQSAEGREIYMAVLGNPDAPRKILIQGGIHGREYMCCQLIMKMLEYYAAFYDSGYYGDLWYNELFEQTAFYVVPMSNPDGVSISQFGEAAVSDQGRLEMMRAAYERDKNTVSSYEEYLSLWKANANGVDINRNFNAGWEAIEQKSEPGGEFFKGYSPCSEPETIALENLVNSHQFDKLISYHARGQIIYYDTVGITDEMSQSSYELAELIHSVCKYSIVNCNDASNVVQGGLGDWTMLEKGVESATLEIGKGECPLSIEEFKSVWYRNREIWAKLAWTRE